MKQLKSSIEDLREIFERDINASYITEPLYSFDESTNVQRVKIFMDKMDFDVIGIRKNGIIKGYACKKDLDTGQLGQYFKDFDKKEVFSHNISISEVMKKIIDLNRIFISSFNTVTGIITQGDLQKMPIRMWLFSLVSLIEMQLLRIIYNEYPDGFWKRLISSKRVEKAEYEFEELKKRNKEISLLDCLQFCDKREIICKSDNILNNLQIHKNNFYRLLKDLEGLRNNLAHAQDIIMDDWPKVITLSNRGEELLRKCEKT